MRAPFLWAIFFFLVGLFGGATYDAAPVRNEVRRGKYVVLAMDFHAHTRFSDGFISPVDLVQHARRKGLDGIAVTEHNMVFPSKIAALWSKHTGGPLVVHGEEVTTSRWHLIALGIQTGVSSRQSLDAALDDIHRQGGVAIAAHPVEHFWPALVPAIPKLDGAEVMHPLAYGRARQSETWRWDTMRAFFEKAREEKPSFTAIGSSDYHAFSPLGLCKTLVFAERADEASVIAALRAGRTVVYDKSGKAWGDPEAIAMLESEPYPMREEISGYAARGRVDSLTRLLGLLGALGILVFRPRALAPEFLSSRASSA
ncbi:MAG: CehA/McbA family metallohydrolase [Polyangiales bacterium]